MPNATVVDSCGPRRPIFEPETTARVLNGRANEWRAHCSKPVPKNTKLAEPSNSASIGYASTTCSRKRILAALAPHFLPASDLELQGKFARLQRHYLSYCRLVWNVLMYHRRPPKRAAPKRRRGCVQAKMAQAAGGSKCGRGGAERLGRGSARMSRTRRLLRVGWMARRGREREKSHDIGERRRNRTKAQRARFPHRSLEP